MTEHKCFKAVGAVTIISFCHHNTERDGRNHFKIFSQCVKQNVSLLYICYIISTNNFWLVYKDSVYCTQNLIPKEMHSSYQLVYQIPRPIGKKNFTELTKDETRLINTQYLNFTSHIPSVRSPRNKNSWENLSCVSLKLK